MKKIALISTFCDTEEKQNILKENITRLKSLNVDVMVISPRWISIPEDIIKSCDYFFYTKENPLLVWPQRMYTHWYQMPIGEGKITVLQRGLPDYGWAALYQTKKLSQISLSFDHEIFYHMIYDLEIDEVVEKEILDNSVNIVHPRRNPNHPEEIWETTLHFMSFDRIMMEKIEKEITLENYQSTNGVAEGEVLKWKNKFNLRVSDHPVKDKIFYWENYDFFDYSPYPDFKMFISKNEEMSIWLGENPCYESNLTSNLRIVFHGFEVISEIKISVNGTIFSFYPKKWEIIEIPISSSSIEEIIFEYNSNTIDFSEEYKKIMLNQIYYNHRP
jgi:hypothetical protein